MTPEVRDRIEQIRHGNVPEGYRKTKAGILPADWTVCMFDECLERVERPVDVQADELYTQIGIRSHGKGLFHKESVTGESLGNKAVYWIEPDCFVLNIVFAWEQAIGKTTQAEVGMIGSHRFPMYRPIDGKVDIDYLISYLLTKRGKDILEAASPGGAGRNRTLGQDRFMKSKIVLPSPNEQKKIAEILTAQDKLIELKEKRLVEKQRQKKHLMQQLLTGKKRLPGFDGEWKRTRLGAITSMNSGGTPDSQDPDNYGTDYVWVSIRDMSASGKYILSSERKLSQKGFNTCSAKIYPKGTVLFAMYASIGECAVCGVECCSSQAILGLEPSEYIVNEYLYYFLLNGREEFKKLSQASSQPNLNKKIVESIVVQLPTLEEQTAITEVLSAADHEIDLLVHDLEQEKQKKKALMQLLLTGIVRV